MKKTKDAIFSQGTTAILRLAILMIGAVVLALCIFALPAMWREVTDEFPFHSFVLYAILIAFYASAVPFFIALQQSLRLLGYINKNQAFSMLSVSALKRIAYCGIAISAVFAASMPFFYIWAEKDDAPGLVVISIVLTTAPLVVSVFASLVQRLLRQAIEIKSENDLTV